MRSLRKRLFMKLRLNLHIAHNPIMFSTNLNFDLLKLPILINLHILETLYLMATGCSCSQESKYKPVSRRKPGKNSLQTSVGINPGNSEQSKDPINGHLTLFQWLTKRNNMKESPNCLADNQHQLLSRRKCTRHNRIGIPMQFYHVEWGVLRVQEVQSLRGRLLLNKM